MFHTLSRRAASSLSVLLIALSLGACAALLTPEVSSEPVALKAGQYTLDDKHAVLLWKVSHLGLSQYVGRFNTFDAALDFEESSPESARLSVVVDTASIDVNFPKFEEDLRGGRWFNTEAHPQATFESTGIEVTGDATGRVTGDFTLLGVTKPVTFEVTFVGGARNPLSQSYTVGFEARTVIQRSEFGMDAALPAVGDAVELEIHAEFVRD